MDGDAISAPDPPTFSKGQRRLLLLMGMVAAAYPAGVLSGLLFPESDAIAGVAIGFPLLAILCLIPYLLLKSVAAIVTGDWYKLGFPGLALLLQCVAAFMAMVAYTHGDELTKGVVERAGASLEASNFTAIRLKELVNQEAMRSRHGPAILKRIFVGEAEGKPHATVVLSLLMTGDYDPANRKWTYSD